MHKEMCLISDYRGRKDQISAFPSFSPLPKFHGWFHLLALCLAMFCKNCGGFCSRGWKFCSTWGSHISEEFNGNGGQTRHADKSDKPLCFADFVKLLRDDRSSQTKKCKKKPTKDEEVIQDNYCMLTFY